MKKMYVEAKARSDVKCPIHGSISLFIQRQVNRDLAEELAKRDENKAPS